MCFIGLNINVKIILPLTSVIFQKWLEESYALYFCKNYKRKRRAQKKESEILVSIPLALLPLHTECVVSLPLSVYT